MASASCARDRESDSIAYETHEAKIVFGASRRFTHRDTQNSQQSLVD